MWIKWRTKASIFVLVWKLSSWILFIMLEDLNPLMVVLVVWLAAPRFVVKSAVITFEHVGHGTGPKEAEKSIKQALQKACWQLVTWSIKRNF